MSGLRRALMKSRFRRMQSERTKGFWWAFGINKVLFLWSICKETLLVIWLSYV